MSESGRSKLKSLLSSPRIGIVAVLIAVGLNLPSVPTGWYLDDLFHRAQFLEVGPLTDASNMTHRMFDFLSGDPEELRTYKDLGVLPWWAEDNLKIRFWRPLSSFTHVVDYALWPDSGPLMHAHNVAWLAVVVLSVAAVYRRLIPVPLVAGLAATLYALDDAHGMPVAFLANRNALIATSFGVISLWLHDRYRRYRRFRRDGWSPSALLSPLAFLAALLGGESGIGISPYLLGYALFIERQRGVAALATVAPHAIIGLLWLGVYKMGGYGTYGSGFYLDPLGEPMEWFAHFLVRAPLLLLGQWFVPPSSFAFAWTPDQMLGVAIVGVGFLAILLAFLRPILKADPVARFFTFGMLLSVVPITAGFPHDRLLFFVGIGAMGLLAMLLVRLFDHSVTSGVGRVFGWALIVVHVIIAAPFQLVMSTSIASQEPVYAGPPRSLPDEPALEAQRLVVVNPPNEFYGQYTLSVLLFDERPAPRNILMLAPGISALAIERLSDTTLSIEAERGWQGSEFDILYRARNHPVPEDYHVELTGVRIDVVSLTDDGRPKRVEFSFERELEHASLRWVRYESGRYVPFEIPATGVRVEVDAIPFSLFAPPTPPPPPRRER